MSPTVLYYGERLVYPGPMIYFAGPTRDENWHQEGIEILQDLGYTGAVALPTPRDGIWHDEDAEIQMLWQLVMQNQATAIAFWFPRIGLASLVEFGAWYNSGKAVLGVPHGVDGSGILLLYARASGNDAYGSLARTLREAARMACSQ